MNNHTEPPTHRRKQETDITPTQKTEMVTLRNGGKSYLDISIALGLPENWISRHLKNHPEVTFKHTKTIPAEVITKMVTLRNEGNTYPKIAAQVGLSKDSVSKHLKNHPDVTLKTRGS